MNVLFWQDEVQFGIESFDAKTTVVPQQIVVAFGRSIHLKTKHQNYVAMGDVQVCYKLIPKIITKKKKNLKQ